ncbi:hypothetical protein HA402_013433 [Bradysia odoriphaga]|nr:hypothetical protein HA402_013433 [Bradysia odoriphaga]
MKFSTSIAAVLVYLSLVSVQSYNILQESPSPNVHGGPMNRYHEVDYAIRKWPDGIAYFTIDSSLSKFESEILRAIRQIEGTTCIRFVTRTDEINYISMRMVDTGCSAPVGFQNSGPQDILIYEPECGFYSYFLHQLIQSLGSIHEHQRSDRDEYITVQMEDLPECKLSMMIIVKYYVFR